MTTRVKMIIETLKANPEKKFTARDLAEEFIQRYPKDIAEKQNNPRYNTKDKLITQLAAEIGGERTVTAKKKCPNITTIDQPRPRIYYWSENQHSDDDNFITNEQEGHSNIILPTLKEYDLYPMLIEYMKDQGLYCQRINEKTSVNSHGTGGNHWLHPDIVALEPLDQQWNEAVRSCVRNSNNSSIRLWSFEVKKQLTKGNVRECFFQAVSNSSWANYGYLVTTGFNDNVEDELRILCGLHGIGVLTLNTESLFDSQILIPAQEKANIDWKSVNRIANENKDFRHYIEQVSIYNQTGKLTESVWNNYKK